LDAILLGARLVLAGVLTVAGVAKLLDRSGTREGLAGFGLPAWLVRPLAGALPAVELAVAAALVPRMSAWWGGLGALSLFVAFTSVIALSLARGQHPECRCFGQLRAAPVGWPTLLRNVGLGALAVFVVGAGWSDSGLSVVGWLVALPSPERTLAVLGLTVLAGLGAVAGMVLRLLVQQMRLLTRLDAIEARVEEGSGAPPGEVRHLDASLTVDALPVGALAPAFALPAADGEVRSLGALLGLGRPVLLLFVGPACDPCTVLAPEIASWQREHAQAFTLALITTGGTHENRTKFSGMSETTLLQARNEVADAYGAQWTPGAVLIGRTGRIASPVVFGDVAIRALVTHAGASPGVPFPARTNGRESHGSLPMVAAGPPRPGQVAPPFALPDLDSRVIDLRSYRGRDTLLVFWHPDCSYCQQMTEELHRWEAEPPRGAPRLLVVSSGSVEANRAQGFRSTVVLDEGSKLSKVFGVRGTPSAVLIDAEGRVASTIGVGARNVLALAGVPPVIERPGAHPPGM
jgi:peroxiredoxin